MKVKDVTNLEIYDPTEDLGHGDYNNGIGYVAAVMSIKDPVTDQASQTTRLYDLPGRLDAIRNLIDVTAAAKLSVEIVTSLPGTLEPKTLYVVVDNTDKPDKVSHVTLALTDTDYIELTASIEHL